MATYTSNVNLKKPAETEFFDIEDFNSNSDIIDVQFAKRICKPLDFTVGNLLKFTTGGEVVDSGKNESDFMPADADYETVGADASGAAQTVQTNLTAHTNDNNKHLTSAEKTKISSALTTSDIVVSASQPTISEGRIWIKVV